jgi:NADH dehydrogenase
MPVTLIGESNGRHSFIAESDMVQFATGAARRADVRDVTLALGGPDAITFRDAAKAYERALGRPVPVRTVPPGAPLPGLPEIVSGIAAAFEAYDSVIPMGETSAAFGVALTSADAFARRRVAEGLGRG